MVDFSVNRFTERPMEENPREETFARDWEELTRRHDGTDRSLLMDMCVELHFPVRAGQSESPELLAALKHGRLPGPGPDAWAPEKPEGISVYLHQTPVGRLPVIECAADADFIRLQQSLVWRCEPRPVPHSRGATLIMNYNNWARIRLHGGGPGSIPKDPGLYRDCIALLSNRFYSGVAPEVFGLTEDDWRRKSLVLRRAHEAAHYMTLRYYHTTKNDIHDELIADFMGLTAAFGEYEPEKILTFWGLEGYPGYRKGGRLELYLGGEPPSAALMDTVRRAAMNVADYHGKTGGGRLKTFHTLCRTSVADMARGDFS